MGMGFIKKSSKGDAAEPRGRKTSTADKTSISGERPGASQQPSGIATRRAAFLASVAGDCGCPRCCGLRDLANTVMNPGSEY